MYNPTPQSFGQAEVDALKTSAQGVVTEITNMNNTNTALTKDERREGVTVGPRRADFNDYYFGNKDNYPQFKPGQTKITEVDAEQFFFIHSSLPEIKAILLAGAEMIDDMILNAEHYTFDHASDGRDAANNAKANGLPGADTWADELNARFPDTSPGGGEEPQP